MWAYGTDDKLAYHGQTRGYSGNVTLVPALTKGMMKRKRTSLSAFVDSTQNSRFEDVISYFQHA